MDSKHTKTSLYNPFHQVTYFTSILSVSVIVSASSGLQFSSHSFSDPKLLPYSFYSESAVSSVVKLDTSHEASNGRDSKDYIDDEAYESTPISRSDYSDS